MTDLITDIMVEVLSILAIVTKDVKQGRLSELIIDTLFRKLHQDDDLKFDDGKHRHRG